VLRPHWILDRIRGTIGVLSTNPHARQVAAGRLRPVACLVADEAHHATSLDVQAVQFEHPLCQGGRRFILAILRKRFRKGGHQYECQLHLCVFTLRLLLRQRWPEGRGCVEQLDNSEGDRSGWLGLA
jgi:hypothetical protein